MALNAKQSRFVAEYLVDMNATQAAIRAGYSKKTSYSQAHDLLKKPEISKAIAAARQRLQAKTELTTEMLLRENARIGFSDARRLFDKAGVLLPVHDWADDIAAAVASIEVSEHYEGQGKSRRMVAVTKKVKLWDKNSALEKLMKHLGLFEKDNRQRADVISDFFAAVSGKSRGLPHDKTQFKP